MRSDTQVQYKFKGFKITAKEFRRNLLLRGACSSQSDNYLSEKQLRTLKPEKLVEVQPQPSIQQTLYLRPQTVGQNKMSSRSYQRIKDMPNQLKYQQSQNKRMNEYLGVVLKKMESDSDKIVKTMTTQNKSDFIHKVNNRTPSANFIRRLKINSIKVRKKANRTSSAIENNIKFTVNTAYQVLQKLKKTEETLAKNKIRIEKELQKQCKRYNSTNRHFLREHIKLNKTAFKNKKTQ